MEPAAPVDIHAINEEVQRESAFITLIRNEVGRIIVGQHYLLDRLLIALVGNGHILVEGVPGLAKTLAIKSLAEAIHARFSRIQFTPDLLPADIIGTVIYDFQSQKFVVKKGPVFANLVLADEINRAPAKVQSALLEAMQERQVTIGEETFPLPDPFMVMATQNPIEQEGTYPLPEAQVDRFMLKVVITYPEKEQERRIIRQNIDRKPEPVRPVATTDDVLRAQRMIPKVYLDEKMESYILDIVEATRAPERYGLENLKSYIAYGASPRASINLALGSRAHAFIKQRGFVIPEDVRALAYDVLRHRIGLTYEAEADEVSTEQIIAEILNKVEIP